MVPQREKLDLKKIRNFIIETSEVEIQKLGPDFWEAKKILEETCQEKEPDFTLTSSEINAYLG